MLLELQPVASCFKDVGALKCKTIHEIHELEIWFVPVRVISWIVLVGAEQARNQAKRYLADRDVASS